MKNNSCTGTRFIWLILFLTVYFPVWLQAAGIKYAIIPENPLPGEPVTIGVDADSIAGIKNAVLYNSRGKQLAKASFFKLTNESEKPSIAAAVLTIPVTASAGFAHINIESALGIALEIPLVIKERQFNSEIIELNEALTGIRADPDPRKTAESEYLWAILNRTGSEIYSAVKFSPPLSSTRRTSFFGDRRVYKYSTGKTDTSIHAGIDYGVPVGTKVYACAAGKVVLAKYRIVTGNSVIVEHAPGIYSLYYHFDKLSINEGDLVHTGTLLGTSGVTGLATGPHLHWEIRVSGEFTDPDAFINRHILDKDAILAKIIN
jgi:murein DD-endopeptidase MepM/ murein hydrolase activator NlpD